MNKITSKASFSIEDIGWIVRGCRDLWAHKSDGKEASNVRALQSQVTVPRLAIPSAITARLKSLHPCEPAYKEEILKLWKIIYEKGGNDAASYSPEEHEKDASHSMCPIRFPGYFARRHPGAVLEASNEMYMLADILRYSKLSSGKRVLEYGAGSGNIAITLSRLGVEVDTVDISDTYCDHIKMNANFYGTKLTPFNQEFGYRPGGKFYDCIIFHACFHHALDHASLVEKISGMIADDGVILLSNEPINPDAELPWFLRNDLASIAVIAARGWMELGFSFDYLAHLFFIHGLHLEAVASSCAAAPPLHIAKKLGKKIRFDNCNYSNMVIEDGYDSENCGTWTSSSVKILICKNFDDCNDAVVSVSNIFPLPKEVSYELGSFSGTLTIEANSSASFEIPLENASKGPYPEYLKISCNTTRPFDYFEGSQDKRDLGILLTCIEYI